MGAIVFAFDLDTVAMKSDQLSKSERNSIYRVETKKALRESGFSHHLQGSVYATPRAEYCLETTFPPPWLVCVCVCVFLTNCVLSVDQLSSLVFVVFVCL